MSGYVLRRRIHISWLIAWACVGIIMGVIGVQYVPQASFSSLSWLLAGVGLFALVAWKRWIWMVMLAIVAGCLVGLWRGSTGLDGLVLYERIQGSEATIRGVVSEDVDTNKRGQLVLRLKDIALGEHTVGGMVWVTLDDAADIKRSDIVTIRGEASEGFGSFAAAMYSAELVKLQRKEPGDVALTVRDEFAEGTRAAIPEPEVSLGLGYLVGQRRGLPEELMTALQVAGLTHVIVASGYNLTILVRLARRLFEKVSKYLSALMSGGLIVAFMAVTGASPSMSRASLVAGLSLLAWYYGRTFHPLVLLPFAAAVTLIINPSYGWGDLGWQLSFAAFAGVMILAPLLQAYYFGEKKPGIMRQIVGETVAAWLVTLPILLVAFGQMSNVAIVANLLILPLVPLAMLLVFIAGIAGLLFVPIAPIVGYPAYLLLHYMTQTANWIAGFEWAQTELTITWWQAAVVYMLLAGFCVYMWRVTRFKLSDSSIVE